MLDEPHVNQPGGERRQIDHPAVVGRETELRLLIDNVRRLAAACVDHRLDPAETAALAERVGDLADALDAAKPDESFPRFSERRPDDAGPHDTSPFDLVFGLYNPLALPIRMAHEGDRTIGWATYGTLHEGAPGCVHGAAIAGSFDMILSAATSAAGIGGPTAYLTSQFRHRTVLDRAVRYEGWVDDIDGRKVLTRGQLVQDDEVTVEAEALFITLDRSEIMRLSQRGRP